MARVKSRERLRKRYERDLARKEFHGRYVPILFRRVAIGILCIKCTSGQRTARDSFFIGIKIESSRLAYLDEPGSALTIFLTGLFCTLARARARAWIITRNVRSEHHQEIEHRRSRVEVNVDLERGR